MKPIRIPFLWLFAPVLALQFLVFNGCSTPTQTLVAQLAVQRATYEVVKDNPARAARVVAIAGEVEALAGGETADTVALLITLVRAKIQWEKLSPPDRQLVETLLAVLQAELESKLGSVSLPEEKLLVVKTVAGWVKTAAATEVVAP